MMKISELPWREVVRLLELEPHPEGGFYRETFRDARVDADGRSASTAIYFLLPSPVVSRWHRIDASEVWHWYAGATLQLSTAGSGTTPDRANIVVEVLGTDLASGERPQCVVSAGAWQQAQSLGDWTLVGCTVAPGFEFERFEIA